MEYFKHYSDARIGSSMQRLLDEFGHQGYAVYFMLLESCAAKMKKSRYETFNDSDCFFRFNVRFLCRELRTNDGKLSAILGVCQAIGLFRWEIIDHDLLLEVPNFLKYLSKDQKRVHHDANFGAYTARLEYKNKEYKNVRIEKNIKKEPIENASKLAPEPLAPVSLLEASSKIKAKRQTNAANLEKFKLQIEAEIYKAFPRKQGKRAGLIKIAKELASGRTLDEIKTALDKFINHHKQQATEPKFIPHFSTWANNWEEWLEDGHGQVDGIKRDPFELIRLAEEDKGG